VGEVIIIDRDTKQPAIYRLTGPQYVALQPDPDGWVSSETLHVRLKRAEGESGRASLVIEDRQDPSKRHEI
jgi:Uma2 family endonuclease